MEFLDGRKNDIVRTTAPAHNRRMASKNGFF